MPGAEATIWQSERTILYLSPCAGVGRNSFCAAASFSVHCSLGAAEYHTDIIIIMKLLFSAVIGAVATAKVAQASLRGGQQLRRLGQVLWREDFNSLADGTTTSGASAGWSIDISGVEQPAIFEVHQGAFRASNTDGEGIWRSEVIDIAGHIAVDVSVDIRKEGRMEEDYDYLKLAYILDGGDEQVFAEKLGNFEPETASASALKGETLQLVIRERNSFEDEFHYWDSIQVALSGQQPAPTDSPTTPPTKEPTASSSCELPWTGPDYDVSTNAVFASEVIDTSCIDGDVVLSLELSHTGSLENSGGSKDTLQVHYSVGGDGLQELWLDVAGDLYTSNGPSEITVAAGDQLTIWIAGRTTHSSETYQIRKFTVKEAPTREPTVTPTHYPTGSPTVSPKPTSQPVPTTTPSAAPFAFEDGKWIVVDNNAPIDLRNEACMVMVGRKAYLVGGRGSKDLDIYDPVTRTWSKGQRPGKEINHMQCKVTMGQLVVLIQCGVLLLCQKTLSRDLIFASDILYAIYSE